MVTICTARLTFNNSTFCPRSVFMCFVWISEPTAIISLYSINWLVSITVSYSSLRGTHCLYMPLQHNSVPTKCHVSVCNSSTQGQYAQCPFLCAAPSKYLLPASLCPIAVSRLCLSKSLASLLTDNLAQYSLTTHSSPFPCCFFSRRPEQIAVMRLEYPHHDVTQWPQSLGYWNWSIWVFSVRWRQNNVPYLR